MPTTTLSQHAITNLGPLTTVFTAPPACATRSPALYLAGEYYQPPDRRIAPLWPQKCDYQALSDCFPSGSILDEIWTSASSLGFPGAETIAYFSPASLCPDAHTTVGVAAKNSDGEVKASGVFLPPLVANPVTMNPDEPIDFVRNLLINVFVDALDKDETAVICCPKDYSVGFEGGCFSEVPESVYDGDGPKTACSTKKLLTLPSVIETITYNNTVLTGYVVSHTETSVAISTRIDTFTGVRAESWLHVDSRPAVTMVYNTASPTATGDGGSGSDVTLPTETSRSAAHSLRMSAFGGSVGVLATAWGIAALASVALAVPF